MVDKKISELTIKTSLTGAEELVVRDAGNNSKVTAQDIAELFSGNSSAFAPAPRFNETRVEHFPSGHGWVKQSAAGTQTDDTTDYLTVDRSLKLTTDGDGAAVFTRKTFASVINFTNKSLVIQFKVNDFSKVTELKVYITHDGFTSFAVFPLEKASANFVKDNDWTTLTMNLSDLVVTGSPNYALIDQIQLRVKDDSSGPIAVNFGSIGIIDNPAAGFCSITFDDGWVSQYTEAKKKMAEYGFPGVAYVIKANADTANYMTTAQIKELQDLHGWEISVHHETNLTTVSLAEAEDRIIAEKEWLLKNGFGHGVDHFAIPNGAFDPTYLSMFKKYFRTSRTIAGTAETFPPADWSRLRVMQVLNTTTPATVATAVTDAINNKYWLILLFHKLVASPTVSTEYSITDFITIIDDIQTQGIPVKTISQGILDG